MGGIYIPTPIIINSFDYDGPASRKKNLDTVFHLFFQLSINKLRYQDLFINSTEYFQFRFIFLHRFLHKLTVKEISYIGKLLK